MDSMRHLSTSLPVAGRQRSEPPNDLISSFKAAALSVTNLYKTAAVDLSRARAAGYQDALDDLLVFLDKESLGLNDGEGWRVRQWATERLDGAVPGQTGSAGSDDDQETAEEDVDARSSSPGATRKPAMPVLSNELAPTLSQSSPRRTSISEPPPQYTPEQSIQPPEVPSIPDFSFRSQQVYPTNHERQAQSDMEVDTASRGSTPSSAETVRRLPRSRTNNNKHHNSRRENRTVSLNLGAGAGSKRKTPYPDFFDITGFSFDNDKKDGGGRGPKRGRHV